MNSLTIDRKKKKLLIQDNNKKLVYLIRFVFGLNVLNAMFFFAIFNSQEDILKWLWLVFAILNVMGLYVSFAKLSLANEITFSEVDEVRIHSIFGLILKLDNGKFRKIFLQRDSNEAEKLQQLFSKI